MQKNTHGGPDGHGSEVIMAGEKAAVAEALVVSRIPTPSGENWEAIRAHYQLPEAVVVDKVQSKVTLPPGWTIVLDPTNPYGRCCIIKDHTGAAVGSTFLKNTGYDYFGNTNFKEDRLKTLGIIA